MRLRYVSLFFLMLNFIACFELMRIITGSALSAILLPLIFLFSQAIGHAIEVRPDNLQTLFLTLGLICLALAMKDVQIGWAVASGMFLGLMLLTNLKSIVALTGIYAGLAAVSLRRKEPLVIQIGSWLLAGLLAVGLAGCSALYLLGALKNYYFYNVAMNFLLASDPAKSRSWNLSTIAYIIHRPWLTFAYLVTIGLWFVSAWRYPSRLRNFELVLGITTIFLVCGKIAGLWLQYDLIFLPLLSAMLSWTLVSIIGNAIHRFGTTLRPLSPATAHALAVAALMVVFSIYYYTRVIIHIPTLYVENHAFYLQKFRDRLNYVANHLSANETVESLETTYGGLGFQPHASYLIVKNPLLMKLQERIEGRNLYGPDYARLFDVRHVKFIFGHPQRLTYFPQLVQDYVQSHYRYQNWLWVRTAPFAGRSLQRPILHSPEPAPSSTE